MPVDWVDDENSRVDLVATAVADLKGVVRLLKGFATGDIPMQAIRAQFGDRAGGRAHCFIRVRFAAVGVMSTVAYLLIFLLLAPSEPRVPIS